MRKAISAVAALLLASCDATSGQDGAQLLSRVNEDLAAGNVAAAKARVDRHDDTIGPDPVADRAGWCSESAFRDRLNDTGARAARSLVASYESTDDPVTRYALIQKDFESSLDSEDESLRLLCAEEPQRISTSAYDTAREPLAQQMRSILTPLEQAARAKIPDKDFNKIVERAQKEELDQSRKESEQRCRELRAEESGPSYERSAVQQQGRDALLQACDYRDRYNR